MKEDGCNVCVRRLNPGVSLSVYFIMVDAALRKYPFSLIVLLSTTERFRSFQFGCCDISYMTDCGHPVLPLSLKIQNRLCLTK